MKSLIALQLALLFLTTLVDSAPLTGVTEPKDEIDLAFPESGILSGISVEEGDEVKTGQLLMELESTILNARRKIAEIKAGSLAGIRSARADLQMRERRLEQVRKLGSRSSNPDELARTEADYEMALAAFQTAEENSAAAGIELELVEAEIERRKLRSPIDGVVDAISRDAGESVVGVDTAVIRVVDLSQLHLVVHMKSSEAISLEKGATVRVAPVVTAEGLPEWTLARIEFISPTANPSSGTRKVRLVIDNPDSIHQSGVKYQIDMDGGAEMNTAL